MKRWLMTLGICMLAVLGADERPYEAEATPVDKKNISFIIRTLADKPLPKLPFYKGSLEAAGEKVDHLHPLQFMQVVFTDERLKAAMRNLVKRDWVFDSFMDDMGKSLEKERVSGTISSEQIQAFAEAVSVDVELIQPSAESGKWKEFVVILVDKVPRKGDHGRYDS
jgi:hypothetical protein